MDINSYLLLALMLAVLVIAYLASKLRRVQTQLSLIKDATNDIKGGNLNRRVLAQESDLTKQICYDINEIALNGQLHWWGIWRPLKPALSQAKKKMSISMWLMIRPNT